jgi:hypothetical protein
VQEDLAALIEKDDRYSIIGHKHRALSRYYMILNRLNNTNRNKNTCYQNIKMLIDKDTFISWFMENDFEGASVDRIDKTKDYTIDNIQMLPLDENIRKDKIKAKNGMCECYVCKETKPLEMFAKDKRRKNGHSTICKKCDVQRKKRKKNNN